MRKHKVLREFAKLGISQRGVFGRYLAERVLARREELSELRDALIEVNPFKNHYSDPPKELVWNRIGPAIGGVARDRREVWSCSKEGADQVCTCIKTHTQPSGRVIKAGAVIRIAPWAKKDQYNKEYVAAGHPKLPPGGGGTKPYKKPSEPEVKKADKKAPEPEVKKAQKAPEPEVKKADKKAQKPQAVVAPSKKKGGVLSKFKTSAIDAMKSLAGIGKTPTLEWVDYSYQGSTPLETAVAWRIQEQRWINKTVAAPAALKRVYGLEEDAPISRNAWRRILEDKRLLEKKEALTLSEQRRLYRINTTVVLKGLVSEENTLLEVAGDTFAEQALLDEGLLKKLALKLINLQKRLLGIDDEEDADPKMLRKLKTLLGN